MFELSDFFSALTAAATAGGVAIAAAFLRKHNFRKPQPKDTPVPGTREYVQHCKAERDRWQAELDKARVEFGAQGK